ncbi:MAG: DUF1015 domain-containing protein [Acidobacteria bacterium]|nr:DUF1015 domain-containing protein [Acidobacteriota bacterium]
MAHIEPFRALRYNPGLVHPSHVVTQPYDKITREMQERYYSLSPFNLVRIILGKRTATDGAGNDAYTRAAGFFNDWRRQGVFLQETAPSLYRYTQRFVAPGTTREVERRGFIALGKLEDYSAGVVFRHEQTLAKPKADRLDLLRATRAHFGQIFMLYSDPDGEIEDALLCREPPVIDVRDEYQVLHQVWRISDASRIHFVRERMRERKLIIADGHHRYETALAYAKERAPDRRTGSELAPFELAMMTFVNMDSPGLVILPTHRVVHGLPTFDMSVFHAGGCEYFGIEEVDARIDGPRATAILREAGRSGTALLAVGAERVLLLNRPKAPSDLFAGLSFRQQALDVVQLHKCVLERTLGISEEAIRTQQHVTYLRDSGEAIALVRQRAADVAFLMNPVRIDQVRDVALASEVLPQKSTDFYPKLLSGLTIYALE